MSEVCHEEQEKKGGETVLAGPRPAAEAGVSLGGLL